MTSGPRSHPGGTLIVVFLQQMFVLARLTSAVASTITHCSGRIPVHRVPALPNRKLPNDPKSACLKMCACARVRVFFFVFFF